jgi:hypothetical protein
MKFYLTVCCCLLTLGAVAQPGISEMQQAQQQLTGDFFSTFDCSLVLAGLIGITGAARVYHHLQTGKKEFVAEVSAWAFAALFMVLSGVFLRALFGI